MINIYSEPFPEQIRGKIRGMTVVGRGGIRILLDSTLEPEQAKKTLGHELAHIYLKHAFAGGTWEELGEGVTTKADVEMEREADEHAAYYYELFAAGCLPDVTDRRGDVL